LLCVILTLRISPSLDALSLGDDSAKSIGINVGRVYLYVLLLIACLTGTALACGGALPFIGLIAPHFARLRSRPYLTSVLPLSAIIGAGITILADLAARTMRAPIDMDVGIITTLIGAPYFLWLLRRGQNA
jgi:iron complex transport system permease protein